MSSLRRQPAVLMMAAAAFSWGGGTVMTKVTLEQLSPLDVLGVELIVGTIAVWTVLLLRGGERGLGSWRRFWLLGLLEPGLSFALFDFGLDRTGAADGAILLASESLFAALLAGALLGERVSRRVAVAIGVGFAGSVVVGLGETGHGASLLGDALVLAASASAAAYGVAARRVATDAADTDALSVTAVQLLAATVLAAPLVVATAALGHSHLGSADGAHLLAALATGLLGTAIPFLLYNRAIRDIDVTNAALVLNLVPVFGVVLALALLSERPSWIQLSGGAVVLLAAFAAGHAVPEDPPDAGLATAR